MSTSTLSSWSKMEYDTVEPVFKSRIRHVTWAWFTCSMSTGGIALCLYRAPFKFQGLLTIGKIVFIFDLLLFTAFCTGMMLRFYIIRGSFRRSLSNSHRAESLFFPAFWLSIAIIINNIEVYGSPACGRWLVDVQRILYWTYMACALLLAIFQYWFLFNGQPIELRSFVPGYFLPIFPAMLCGTIAATIAGSQPAGYAVPILIGGITCQGLGFMVYLFIVPIYICRLFVGGLPEPAKRPGMFIALGPPSFTSLAVIGMSTASFDKFPAYLVNQPGSAHVADVLFILAVNVGIFLWALSFWLLCCAITSMVACSKRLNFHLGWWAFIFPNVGFTIATIEIGIAIGSTAVLWVSTVLICILVALWLFVGCSHIRAVWRREILWPGKDEDSQ